MAKCVIFDLDGTLLNTLDDLADSCNYVLGKHGLPVYETEKYKKFVGNGIPKLIERALGDNYTKPLFDSVFEEFCSYYDIHKNDKTRPYDGIAVMLEKLKERGVVCVVVTNKAQYAAEPIVKYYFGSLIDKTYGDTFDKPKKPDPYWVEKALNDYSVDKTDAVYVGDSGVDMETAVNAGLFPIGVLWGFREKSELQSSGGETFACDCNELYRLLSEILFGDNA